MFKLHKSLQYTIQLISTVKSEGEKTGAPVSTLRVTELTGISNTYLEQIGRKLRMAKVFKAVRGPKGGYVLIMHPDKVTLKFLVANDVMRINHKPSIVEGKLMKELHKTFDDALKPFYKTAVSDFKSFGKPVKKKAQKKVA